MAPIEIPKRPEGKTLEFKRDLSSPEGALRRIVAIANTAGGTLVLGVEDKSLPAAECENRSISRNVWPA